MFVLPALIAAALPNSDAAPSLADAARHLRADPVAYARADSDGDGRIDDRELETVRRALMSGAASAPAVRWPVAGRDANGDGALTPDELYAEAR